MQTDTISPRPWLARIFLSPDERRLRAGWRLLLQLILLIVLEIVFSIPIAILQFFGLLRLEPSFPSFQFAMFFAITLSVYLARRFLDRRSFASLGLHLDRSTLWDLFAGIAIAGVLMGLIFCIHWAAGWLRVEGFAWQTQSWSAIALNLLFYLLVFVAVGWQEELYSRGYLMQNLADGLNMAWGVALSSLVFALLHLSNPNATWASVIGILGAGLFFAYGYLLTRQLWLPIGLHIGWNLFEGPLLGFPVSGLTTFKLISLEVTGPELLTGGPFGPEAGLVLLPALLLGVPLLWVYAKGIRPGRKVGR